MSPFVLFLIALAGVGWYITEPGERKWFFGEIRANARAAMRLLLRLRRRPEPLDEELRRRTPLVIVTPSVAFAYVAVFIGLALQPGPIDDPALLAWGANAGTETANGEWWRLVTSSFLQPGVVQLTVNALALLAVGYVLERLIGPLAFGAVFLAAAVMGSIVQLSISSIDVVAGGAPAIFGMYGLLIASWTWGAVQGASTTVRLRTVARLAPASAAFVVYHAVASGTLGPAEQMGVATGFLCGLALARYAALSKPPVRKIAMTVAATACLATISVVPLPGVTDVRPTIEELQALDTRQLETYNQMVAEVNKGRATRVSLASFIEQSLQPELAELRRRVETLKNAPPEQGPMLADAETYIRLRAEAWEMRAEALRRSSTAGLREADKREHTAREALRRAAASISSVPAQH